MSQEILLYIHLYGYIGIFILVFSQEIGLPNPIPNEFILTFSGYLIFSKTLNVAKVILSAFSADIVAISFLYIVFYFFGNIVYHKKWKWFPISKEKIDRQLIKLRNKGTLSIFYGRLTPFIRGYVAAMCGIIQLNIKKFYSIALSTSFIWVCFYISLGFVLGPYWGFVMSHLSVYKNYIYAFLISLVILMIVRFFIKK